MRQYMFIYNCNNREKIEKATYGRLIKYSLLQLVILVCFNPLTGYMFLIAEQHESKDDRSIGDLFYLSINELPDVCYIEVVRFLMVLFATQPQERMLLNEGEVEDLLQGFLVELLSKNLRKCV